MLVVRILGLASAAALLSTASLAADLPPPLPPPVYPAPVVAVTSGWYLRADFGKGIQRFGDFEHHQTNPNFVWPASWQIVQKNIGDTDFIDFGIGYQWNNWLRFDVTGEHRDTSELKVIGAYSGFQDFCPPIQTGQPSQTCFDLIQGQHSAWVVMANAYVDLGTWWCLTPFIGAGVGAARHTIAGFTDTGFPFGFSALGFASTANSGNNSDNKWTMAWALHAGVAYNVTNNVKIELAYRYINFGNIDTPVVDCTFNGCLNPQGNPLAFHTLTRFDAQELKIGVRFLLQAPEAPPPAFAPPIMRKG
ncbi:MAG TPA: outer membrane beta-barrel protein [Xanthobacteraceae bacterium]|jgi:opacity protein-like surface antigen